MDYFTLLEIEKDSFSLPKSFPSPFILNPHPLAIQAAKVLQSYLLHQKEWQHNFGLKPKQEGKVIGKMFGVLVVKNKMNEIGFLSAFSGKLAERNHVSFFVPPVFDMLEENGFFNKGMQKLNEINKEIKSIEFQQNLTHHQNKIIQKINIIQGEIQELRRNKKEEKLIRKSIFESNILNANSVEKKQLENQFHEEGLKAKNDYIPQLKKQKETLRILNEELNTINIPIHQLKEKRKLFSAQLQDKLFEEYSFLNLKGNYKSLKQIFKNTPQGKPPAGAGECAAPKLLHFAFLHEYQPIAMAEFWWGLSPKSDHWKHQNFYPSCQGKCAPILNHMLEGL